jgi:hypothetical protein
MIETPFGSAKTVIFEKTALRILIVRLEASVLVVQAQILRGSGVQRVDPGGVRVLLANPRWERRFVKFLELSGVG